MTILRYSDVAKEYKVPRGSNYELQYKGLFPLPIRIGQRSAGFIKEEIDQVFKARIAGADDDAVRALVRKIHADRKNAAGQAV